MKPKEIKIGEYAVGGIVTVEFETNARVVIRCLDFETRAPVLSGIFDFVDKHKIEMWLEDEVTTCYYAEKIMKLIYA